MGAQSGEGGHKTIVGVGCSCRAVDVAAFAQSGNSGHQSNAVAVAVSVFLHNLESVGNKAFLFLDVVAVLVLVLVLAVAVVVVVVVVVVAIVVAAVFFPGAFVDCQIR